MELLQWEVTTNLLLIIIEESKLVRNFAEDRRSSEINGMGIMIRIFKNGLNGEEKDIIMMALILDLDRKWKNYMIYGKNLGGQE